MPRRRLQSLIYMLADFTVTFVVWLGFVFIRRETLEGFGYINPQQYVNATVISIYWMMLYALAGLYGNPFRRSRLTELSQAFKYTLIGVLIIFFLIFLDDPIPPQNPSLQRVLLSMYMGLQFGGIAIVRFIITTRTNMRIRARKMGFPTLVVGCQEQAYKIFSELDGMRRSLGYEFKGYVPPENPKTNQFRGKLKNLGEIGRLEEIIKTRKIEDVIVALEPDEAKQIDQVIDQCERTSATIKVVPGVYDFLVGSAKVSHILGAPLIEVFPTSDASLGTGRKAIV